MSGFYRNTKQVSAGSTIEANVTPYGWTGSEAQSISQIIDYVNQCKGYAEEAATSAGLAKGSESLCFEYVNEAKMWAERSQGAYIDARLEADRSEQYANQSVDIYNAFLNVAANQRIVETFQLTAGQTVINFTKIFADAAYITLNGQRVDGSYLAKDADYIVTGVSEITLRRSYPEATILTATQDIKKDEDPAGGAGESFYVWNRKVIRPLVGVRYETYVSEGGRTLQPRVVHEAYHYLPTFDTTEPVTFSGIPVKTANGTITIPTDKGDKVFSRVIAEAVARGELPSGPDEIILTLDDLSTTSDNTSVINKALNESRVSGKTVVLPAGKFPVSGTLELGGIKLRGKAVGYRNSDGTVLVGSGTNTMFNQSSSAFPYYASTKIESLRIERVDCGLEFGYLNRSEFEDIHINSTGTSIRFGRSGNSGPQWNTMRRCTAESTGGSALYLNGSNWCNNNTFELCFFESKENGTTPAVVIDAAGGYGAIDNIFIGVEVASDGFGVRLKNARSTQLLGCYMECKGPAIWLNGSSYATKVSGGVFARQRINNATGVNWAIYHESGNARIQIDKPYVVVSNPTEQDGCGFIGFKEVTVTKDVREPDDETDAVYNLKVPQSFVVDMTSEPVFEEIGGVKYTRYMDGLFSRVTNNIWGDASIRSDSSPSISLCYEDGTKKTEIYSNSSKGGGDYGTVVKVDGTTRMQFSGSDKVLLPGQKLGFMAESHTTTPGEKTHRIQVLNESGSFLGYLHVYKT